MIDSVLGFGIRILNSGLIIYGTKVTTGCSKFSAWLRPCKKMISNS